MTTCPACESDSLINISGDYYDSGTGETRYEEGYGCEACGKVFDASDIEEDEPSQCVVLECDQPQAPLDTYCAHHALVADDMERLYRGAVIAGWFEGDKHE